MIEAIVRLRPNDWVRRVVSAHPVIVKMSDSRMVGDGLVRDLVEVAAPDENVEAAVAQVRSDAEVLEADLNIIDRTRAMGVVTSRSPARARLAAISGFVDAVRSSRDGAVEYSVYAESESEIKRAVNGIKKMGVECTLVRWTPLDQEALTPRTERILKAAYQRGFFDHPKRVGLRELAKTLNLDPISLGEILRDGRRRIIESYLRGAKLRI